MLTIERELRDISTKVKNELDFVETELSSLPRGRLSCENQGGKPRFVKETYVDNKRKRQNLQPGDPELSGLLRRRLLEMERERLEKNLKILQVAIKDVKDFDINYALFKLKNSMKAIDDEIASNALKNGKNDDWCNQTYEKLNYQDENTKWHMTSFGLRVRSKSELMIAELLHKYNIQFRYEQIIHFQNGSLAPDFTIKRRDGKIFYWEHEGLTNSNIYLNQQLKKTQLYAMNGIVPWENLIITYDNADGIIDMRIIESEIKNKLLV